MEVHAARACFTLGSLFLHRLTTASYHQDNGIRYLNYVDSAAQFPVRNGLEDLPDRIDVSLFTEISTGNCAPPPNVLREYTVDVPSASPAQPSTLSFSLLSQEGSLADVVVLDQSSWADWTDGLNMLRRDGGHVATLETAAFVNALTGIGVEIVPNQAEVLPHVHRQTYHNSFEIRREDCANRREVARVW